jgi:hypothetical protein
VIAPNRDLAEDGFLGSEFLTWLLWRAATDPGFSVSEGGAAEVWVHVDEHVELRGEVSAARRVTLRGGVPGASREVRAALRGGKSVAALRLLLARAEEETRVTLRLSAGEGTVELASVRLAAPEGEDAEERAARSLDALDRLLEDVDLVFGAFAARRAAPGWEAEVERIRSWVAAPSEEEQATPAP